jgi:hypothetical protein
MTKNQANQLLDWLTGNGFSGSLTATLDADGSTIYYALFAQGAGDASKMRGLINQIEQRGFAMTITGFHIQDPPPPPAEIPGTP